MYNLEPLASRLDAGGSADGRRGVPERLRLQEGGACHATAQAWIGGTR